MNHYQKILLALELNPESDDLLLKKAQEFSEAGHRQLYLIHAVEHLNNYGLAYGISAGVDVEEMLMGQAKKSMTEIGARFNIPPTQQITKIGPAKFVILEEAKQLGVDLIVVGSHGRHGVRLLLGSTANAILHGAMCDVLAVRVKE